MINPAILKKLNTDNFKDGELIEFCSHCSWQTTEAPDSVAGKCPECYSSTTFARFDKEFRETTGVKVVKKHGTPKKAPATKTPKKVKKKA